jgi:hypothetical protein
MSTLPVMPLSLNHPTSLMMLTTPLATILKNSLPSSTATCLPLPTDTFESSATFGDAKAFSVSNRSGTTLKLPLTRPVLNLVSLPARFLHHHGYSQLANIELSGFFGRLLNANLQDAKAFHAFDKTVPLLDAITQRVRVQMSSMGEHKVAPFFTITAYLKRLGASKKEGLSLPDQQIIEKMENLKWRAFLQTLETRALVPEVQSNLVIPYLPIEKNNLTLQQRYLNALLLLDLEIRQD